MIDSTDSFGCSSCGRNFSTQGALTKHVNSSDHPYTCALCKTHYGDIGAFRLHLELSHLGYMCTFGLCPYWSPTESDVDRHAEKHSEDEKHADLKARKFGNPAGPEDFLRTSRRRRPHSDHPSKKGVVPIPSSATTGYTFDPRRMVCPFRLAIPESAQNDGDDTYATCRTMHEDISSLMLVLLRVPQHLLSSY